MDTLISEVLVFKLFRAESATGTVTTPSIVIALDIIKHRCPHHFTTGKAFSVNAFYFSVWKKLSVHALSYQQPFALMLPRRLCRFSNA